MENQVQSQEVQAQDEAIIELPVESLSEVAGGTAIIILE